jgi:hypothetical protein
MTRALIAVGTALALLVGGLALVVYLTRDEDNLQVDNALSEDFTRDVQLSEARRADVDLRRLAPFEWTRALVVAPDTPRSVISRKLGYEWKGLQGFETGGEIVILLRADGQVARFFDYRGLGHFAGLPTPIAVIPRDHAIFRVTDLVITPR